MPKHENKQESSICIRLLTWDKKSYSGYLLAYLKPSGIESAFSYYYSTLADNILKKLPTPPNKYTPNPVIQYSRHFIPADAFHLTYTTEIDIDKILSTRL